MRGRTFKVGVPADLLESIQDATLRTRYKGLRFCKNPFDLVLYLRVLERLTPRTIIEIGSSEGGSAVWLRDQARALGFTTRVISLDISPPLLDEEDVCFLHADSARPAETFPSAVIVAAPHPWLEDSAHTEQSVAAVLDYFDPLLEPGDAIVVEDGVVADLQHPRYRQFQDGPNVAVSDFLVRTGDRYVVDTESCDFYGPNVTYCPNAWLIRR